MRVYVYGPYSASDPDKVEANVQRALSVAVMLMHKGHTVYCPHSHGHEIATHAAKVGDAFPWEAYMKQGLNILAACDAIVATQNEEAMQKSRGSLIEREYATMHGLKVFAGPEDVPRA